MEIQNRFNPAGYSIVNKANQEINFLPTTVNGSENDAVIKSTSSDNRNFNDLFKYYADKYGVDFDLAKAVAKAESSFNPQAVSSAGAQGVMQLMPDTAKGLGVKNPFDPEENIAGGIRYLKGMLDKFNGNTSLALAAYNAGSGNVEKYQGIPPFAETRNYVNTVQKYYQQMKQWGK